MFTRHELMNKIKVEVKNNYGSEAIYIVSSHSSAIRTLTGKKTISRADISALQDLGFVFETVTPALEAV